MTPCIRAPQCQKIPMHCYPFVSVKSFPGEERDTHYIPTTPPETFLTLSQVLPPRIGKFWWPLTKMFPVSIYYSRIQLQDGRQGFPWHFQCNGSWQTQDTSITLVFNIPIVWLDFRGQSLEWSGPSWDKPRTNKLASKLQIILYCRSTSLSTWKSYWIFSVDEIHQEIILV